ncbi:MAG TPA: right-handed parallel beta-helix repeat-containing protein [Candidatus Binatia bacterium]|nr:right-handed parallel beta-helix repeat-containing protein [Candidatus Binatia bacterium]
MRFRSGWMLAACLLELSAARVWATDGVVQINQTRALAGGVTPGDAAGFPVTISQPGSYRLVGNLTVPDANTTAIQITGGAGNVTIDLNGFSINGVTVCTGEPNACGLGWCGLTCAPTGTGNGIRSVGLGPNNSVTILNGTVAGMGSDGISLGDNPSVRIENVQAQRNGGSGIYINGYAPSCLVSHCIATHNNGNGIGSGSACVISLNSVGSNNADGIWAGGAGTVVSNTSSRNSQNGITVDGIPSATVSDNMAVDNVGIGIAVNVGSAVIRGNSANQNQTGIWVGDVDASVSNNVARANQSNGIELAGNDTVVSNVATENGGNGISQDGDNGVMLQNSAAQNAGFGLQLGMRTGYALNVVNDNNGDDSQPQVSGGIEVGTNVCGGDKVCP